jgi:hypothetical protein
MNDFIFNVLQAQGATIPTWVPLLGGLPYNSPLMGSFLGIIGAFLVKYIAHKIKDHEDRNYYKKTLRNEITECSNICQRFIEDDGVVNPLPMDCWTSAMNSGALRFFNVDEVDGLSRIYLLIKTFNLLAEIYNFVDRPNVGPYANPYDEANRLLSTLESKGSDLLEEYRGDNLKWLLMV